MKFSASCPVAASCTSKPALLSVWALAYRPLSSSSTTSNVAGWCPTAGLLIIWSSSIVSRGRGPLKRGFALEEARSARGPSPPTHNVLRQHVFENEDSSDVSRGNTGY